MVKEMVVPGVVFFLIQIRPPWASTSPLQMASPNPAPLPSAILFMNAPPEGLETRVCAPLAESRVPDR